MKKMSEEKDYLSLILKYLKLNELYSTIQFYQSVDVQHKDLTSKLYEFDKYIRGAAICYKSQGAFNSPDKSPSLGMSVEVDDGI